MNYSTGTMSGADSFNNVGLPKNHVPVPQQAAVQSMRLGFSADGTAMYKPIAATSPPYQPAAGANGNGGGGEGSAPMMSPGGNVSLSSGEPMKKKRGRPRKYGPDGSMALVLSTAPPAVAVPQSGAAGAFPSSPPGGAAAVSSGPASPNSSKKGRGRPPGSSKKQQMDALGAAGFGFTPHVITVKAGEDVSSKIMAFSQNGPRAICILSANGAISNVTLRQAATSGGTVTYEGRFEILSLTGSFLLSENAGPRSRTGGLSISLSGPDGRVLGGGVAGLLTAASPVQIIVGSFVSEGRKEAKPVTNQTEPLPKVSQNSGATGGGGSSPPSRGTLSESSGGGGSPLNQSNNSNPQGISSMPWK